MGGSARSPYRIGRRGAPPTTAPEPKSVQPRVQHLFPPTGTFRHLAAPLARRRIGQSLVRLGLFS